MPGFDPAGDASSKIARCYPRVRRNFINWKMSGRCRTRCVRCSRRHSSGESASLGCRHLDVPVTCWMNGQETFVSNEQHMNAYRRWKLPTDEAQTPQPLLAAGNNWVTPVEPTTDIDSLKRKPMRRYQSSEVVRHQPGVAAQPRTLICAGRPR